LNAQHLRYVPGRKTDVQDAQWICQLVEHGLVRPSFVPSKPIRELRDLTRYRKAEIEERTREVQRLEKVLQDAGIKLSSVASKVLGVSGRATIDALLSGTHDPEVLAELAKAAVLGRLLHRQSSKSRGAALPGSRDVVTRHQKLSRLWAFALTRPVFALTVPCVRSAARAPLPSEIREPGDTDEGSHLCRLVSAEVISTARDPICR
jgi:transposase